MYLNSKCNNYSIKKQSIYYTGKIFSTLNFILFTLFFFTSYASAQYSIIGQFPNLKGQKIKLMGYSGLSEYVIDSLNIPQNGIFNLKYSKKDLGIGYISDVENKSYLIILEEGGVEIKGESIGSPETIETLKGSENIIFTKYIVQHAKREQVLSAWYYLQKKYQNDKFYSNQKTYNQLIVTEINRIEKDDFNYLSKLSNTSYVYWYLPLRKLLSSSSKVLQYGANEIASTINSFRILNFSDYRFYKSGLYKDAIQSHYWLLENRGWLSLDSIYQDMNTSTSLILESVETNPILYNDLSKYLFEYFEKHSLFEASKYLALNVLNQKKIKINDNLSNQLEFYRSIKIGNIAPEIIFNGDIVKDGAVIKSPLKLSEIISPFKVIIFGASWCSSCNDEIKDLLPLYPKWQSKGLEVLFISMDTEINTFKNYTLKMPFISTCDYKKWDTKAAKDYFIFSSPTFFLLDNENKILLRPKSIKAIDAWVDYNTYTIQ